MTSTTLVLIAERGTDWTSWLDACCAQGVGVKAIIQQQGESDEAFAERARAALDAIDRPFDAE